MATTPVDITVKKEILKELKWALEVVDNPNSAEDGKPKKYKFKQAGVTRYDLAMNYREVSEHHRVIEKIRMDQVRLQLDEQLQVDPLAKDLTGRWSQAAAKDIEAMMDEDVVLKIRPVPLSNLDIENNDIPFTAIGKLIGTVITDDTPKT